MGNRPTSEQRVEKRDLRPSSVTNGRSAKPGSFRQHGVRKPTGVGRGPAQEPRRVHAGPGRQGSLSFIKQLPGDTHAIEVEQVRPGISSVRLPALQGGGGPRWTWPAGSALGAREDGSLSGLHYNPGRVAPSLSRTPGGVDGLRSTAARPRARHGRTACAHGERGGEPAAFQRRPRRLDRLPRTRGVAPEPHGRRRSRRNS